MNMDEWHVCLPGVPRDHAHRSFAHPLTQTERQEEQQEREMWRKGRWTWRTGATMRERETHTHTHTLYQLNMAGVPKWNKWLPFLWPQKESRHKNTEKEIRGGYMLLVILFFQTSRDSKSCLIWIWMPCWLEVKIVLFFVLFAQKFPAITGKALWKNSL